MQTRPDTNSALGSGKARINEIRVPAADKVGGRKCIAKRRVNYSRGGVVHRKCYECLHKFMSARSSPAR